MRMIIFFSIFSILFFSCIYGTREGVVQKDSQSYLHFIGDVKDISIVIDNGEPIDIEREFNYSSLTPNLLYQISPGKHLLRVYRDDELIMDRIIFVSSNETKEVKI